MDPWKFSMTRWPHRTLEIHRRIRDDARFREIIGDYEVARTALQHWRTVDPAGARRITDYEQMVQELEDEIEASLNAQESQLHHPDAPTGNIEVQLDVGAYLSRKPRETSQ